MGLLSGQDWLRREARVQGAAHPACQPSSFPPGPARPTVQTHWVSWANPTAPTSVGADPGLTWGSGTTRVAVANGPPKDAGEGRASTPTMPANTHSASPSGPGAARLPATCPRGFPQVPLRAPSLWGSHGQDSGEHADGDRTRTGSRTGMGTQLPDCPPSRWSRAPWASSGIYRKK